MDIENTNIITSAEIVVSSKLKELRQWIWEGRKIKFGEREKKNERSDRVGTAEIVDFVFDVPIRPWWKPVNRGIHADVIVYSFAHLQMTSRTEENLKKLQTFSVAKALMSSYILCKILSFQTRVA